LKHQNICIIWEVTTIDCKNDICQCKNWTYRIMWMFCCTENASFESRFWFFYHRFLEDFILLFEHKQCLLLCRSCTFPTF
jgi:hypothetical protein